MHSRVGVSRALRLPLDLHTATHYREGPDRFWRPHMVVLLRSGGHLYFPQASFWDAIAMDIAERCCT